MQRRKFLKTAGVGAAAATAVAAPALAQGQPELKWRLASSFPKSLDTLWGGAELFCRRVSELTDGKFKILPFASGEIVPGFQVFDAVQNGTVEIGQTAAYYYIGKDITFTFDTAVPFGMNSRQHVAWWMHGGGREAMAEFYKDYGVVGHMMGGTGAQMGGWFRKEIKTVDDLKGLKFRVGGFAGQILGKLGVIAQQIPGGEIYPALEKGTIDAAEWVGPYDDEKLGFYKVAPYYYYPGWWEGTGMGTAYINQKSWDALPPAYQKVIETTADEITLWMWANTTTATRRRCAAWWRPASSCNPSRRRCSRPASMRPTRSATKSSPRTRSSRRCGTSGSPIVPSRSCGRASRKAVSTASWHGCMVPVRFDRIAL
jgi:TRAP-type mannitol/chloroaromatic compound transport system substrate-binding protein